VAGGHPALLTAFAKECVLIHCKYVILVTVKPDCGLKDAILSGTRTENFPRSVQNFLQPAASLWVEEQLTVCLPRNVPSADRMMNDARGKLRMTKRGVPLVTGAFLHRLARLQRNHS